MLEAIKNFFNTPLQTHADNFMSTVHNVTEKVSQPLKNAWEYSLDSYNKMQAFKKISEYIEKCQNEYNVLSEMPYKEMHTDKKVKVMYLYVVTFIKKLFDNIADFISKVDINKHLSSVKETYDAIISKLLSVFNDTTLEALETEKFKMNSTDNKSTSDYLKIFLLDLKIGFIKAVFSDIDLSKEEKIASENAENLKGTQTAHSSGTADKNSDQAKAPANSDNSDNNNGPDSNSHTL